MLTAYASVFDNAAQVMRQPLTKLERLDGLLQDWATWVRDFKVAVECTRGSAGMKSGGINCYDDLASQVDKMRFEAVTAAVEGLDAMQQAAIDSKYLHSVWRWQRAGQHQVILDGAYRKLVEKLEHRGVVI